MNHSESFNLNDAVRFHQAGRLDEAEAIYRKLLLDEPANANALHLLGVIAYQRKKFDEAADLIGRAIAINRRMPDFHNNLGNVYLALNRLQDAETCYRNALKLNPRYGDAHNNIGNVMKSIGKLQDAAKAYETALQCNPNRPDYHYNAGIVLDRLGRYSDAVSHYRDAVRLKPDFVEAYVNMGAAYKSMGMLEDSIGCCSKALEINPRHFLALFNIGNAYAEGGNLADGIRYYRRALEQNPDHCEANLNLGHALHSEGNTEEAALYFGRALKLNPNSIDAQFGYCIRQIPLIHDSVEEIEATRSRYLAELIRLRDGLQLTDPETIKKASSTIGNTQPFYLAYQGLNDCELQKIYGDLVARIQAANYPSWAKRASMPLPKRGERVRVGILSGFYYLHSNWKIPIKGWVSNINKDEFQLFGYYTGRKSDAETEVARKSFHCFREGIGSVEQWCETIERDRLHVLIFPEIGMDPMTVKLASLRLAPVQCNSWGHPNTSGLPTIDYYLSSDLMEPVDGDSHYSERLVRLPKLSIYYEPLAIQPAPMDRASLGLREESVLFFCAQSLFKYLPQYDEVFPRIAREVGNCQFAFLNFSKSAYLGERFLDRLRKAFQRYDLQCEQYVKFLPHLTPPQYQALNELADVFLDSIGWSGCNSTIEALTHNLPVVTLPGTLMRGRHSYAILTMAGLEDLIVKDLDHYVALAARLGNDMELRKRVSERVAQLKHKIYRDTDCVRGLEDFLRKAIASGA